MYQANSVQTFICQKIFSNLQDVIGLNIFTAAFDERGIITTAFVRHELRVQDVPVQRRLVSDRIC